MRILIPSLSLAAALALSAPANAFEIEFSFEGLKLCTTGNPNIVTNPQFALTDVPKGTKYIRFKLRDHDAPGYDHGGGLVAYSGQPAIEPGAFNYKSPCPPNGTHTYEWTATAQKRKNGGKLGVAKAAQKYPQK